MSTNSNQQQEPLKHLTQLLGKKGVEVAFGLACRLVGKRLDNAEWSQVADEWLKAAEMRGLAQKPAFAIKWYRPYAMALCQPMHDETHKVYYASLKEVTVRKKLDGVWTPLRIPHSLNLYHVSDDSSNLSASYVDAIKIKPRTQKSRRKLVRRAVAQKPKRGSRRAMASSDWTAREFHRLLR